MAEARNEDAAGKAVQRVYGRPRSKTVAALIAIAAIAGFLSLLTTWVERQALETDVWVETSSELLEDPEIQNELADFLVDQLFDNVDVAAELEGVLPKEVKGLSGPAAGGLRRLADEAANEVLARDEVQDLWKQANEGAHVTFRAIVEGDGRFVQTEDGTVVLDLEEIVGQVADEVGLGTEAREQLPDDVAQIEVLQSDQLEAAQTGVDVLNAVDWLLYLLAIAGFALAVYLARGWRRIAVQRIGIVFVLVGIAVLILRAVGETVVVDAAVDVPSVEPAAMNAWSIATEELARIARGVIVLGVLIFAGTTLAGPTQPAIRTRTFLAPYLSEARIVFPLAGLLFLLLVLWSPWGAFDRNDAVVPLAVLMVAGTEVLRRQLHAEHPDTDAEARSLLREERIEQAKDLGRELWRRTVNVASGVTSAARGGDDGDPPAVKSSEDSRLERLERLAALRDSGVLDAEEFAAEKRRILDEGEEPPA